MTVRTADGGDDQEPITMPGYWELEEAEDDTTMHTLLRLLPDGVAELGKSDGPIPADTSATWSYSSSNLEVQMRISRLFDEDGEYPYKVDRLYTGYAERDGPVVSVQGRVVVDDPDIGEITAGYFSLTQVPDFPDDVDID